MNKAQFKLLPFVLVFLLSISIIVFANTSPIIESLTLEIDGETQEEIVFHNPKLAEITIDPSYNTNYTKEYLEYFEHFEDFNTVEVIDQKEDVLKAGNIKKELKGYKIHEKDYIVDLASCDRFLGHCVFLVNGVPTGALYPKNDERYNN